MIIDKEQLIYLLVDKTGLEQEQVKGQLSKLIKRINRAAEEGKRFEVEGFGTFSVEKGALEFTPEDTLQTEINNKYAGMKPIELIGAFKKPEEDEIPDIAAGSAGDKGWTFDEQAAGADADTEMDDDLEKKPLQEVEDMPEQESASEEAQEDFEKLISKETAATEFASDEKNKSKKQDEDPPKEEEEKEDPIGRLLVAAVVVITLGVSGFLIYDLGLLGKDSGSSVAYTQAEEQPQNMQTSENVAISANDSKDRSEPDEPEEVGTPEDNPESSENIQSTYGLKGEFNPATNNGYTIVVHSLRSLEQAESNRQPLQESGYRTVINQANVQGTTYYRVGIGQFETIGAAQEAIDQIPEPYQSNNFIKRIK